MGETVFKTVLVSGQMSMLEDVGWETVVEDMLSEQCCLPGRLAGDG